MADSGYQPWPSNLRLLTSRHSDKKHLSNIQHLHPLLQPVPAPEPPVLQSKPQIQTSKLAQAYSPIPVRHHYHHAMTLNPNIPTITTIPTAPPFSITSPTSGPYRPQSSTTNSSTFPASFAQTKKNNNTKQIQIDRSCFRFLRGAGLRMAGLFRSLLMKLINCSTSTCM